MSYRAKEGLWSLGERKAKVLYLGQGGRSGHAPERVCLRKGWVGKGSGVLRRESVSCVLCPEDLYLLPKGRDLRGGLGGGSR